MMFTKFSSSSKTFFTLSSSTLAVTTLGSLQIVSITFILLTIRVLVENAKIFKEELLKRNVKNSTSLNLQSLRLGINAIIALSNPKIIATRRIEKLNLADNAVTDYGMHAVKNIINNTKINSLNLASNMISGEGLELFLDDLISNTCIK